MELCIQLEDPDIISYINNIKNNKNKEIQDLLSIGIKCKESVKLDTSSCSQPIIDALKMETDEINEKLDNIFTGFRNSTRKGAMSENILANQLTSYYQHFIVDLVSSEGKQGDIHIDTGLKHGNYKIMVENKAYGKNVDKVEVDKFKRDMIYSDFDYGIFHSATSGIIGMKNNLEWEIYQGKILVYVHSLGLEGAGCIIAMELMLALIDADILNTTHNYFYENFESSKFQEIILSKISELELIGSELNKFNENIKEQETAIIKIFQKLRNESFDICCNYNRIIKDIVKDLDFKIYKRKIIEFDEEEYLNSIDDIKLRGLYYKIIFMIDNSTKTKYKISRVDDDLLLMVGEDIKYTIKKFKKKCEIKCPFDDNTDEIVFNRKFSKVTKSEIIIEISNDNCDLFDYVKKNLNL